MKIVLIQPPAFIAPIIKRIMGIGRKKGDE